MKSNVKSLRDLTDDIVSIYREYRKTGTNPWTYDTAINDLPYQVGSLIKCAMQLRGDRYAEGKSADEVVATISDELVDILAEVLFIARSLDIDLLIAWDKMLASDAEKISKRASNSGR